MMTSINLRHGQRNIIVLIWSILLLGIIFQQSSYAMVDCYSFRLEDTGVPLINPGMGWVFHFFDDELDKYGSKLPCNDGLEDFPGLAVIYLRIPWAFIEPREGEFHWAVIDTQMQRWGVFGKKIALRITCTEASIPYATPQWVKGAGAKGYFFQPGKGVVANGPDWEPDYDDPIFLSKLEHFLAELAARYDGNPDVAFVDIGSFGIWGEGHTLYFGTEKPYSAATIHKHIDLHRKYFKKTLLVINDEHATQGRGQEVIDYAFNQGLTFRDDSILVHGGTQAYTSAGMAQRFAPSRPVIIESEHYGLSKQHGHWGNGAQYLAAVEDYHASYASIHWWPREFLAENKMLVDQINRRLGYRLNLREASWPKQARAGSTLAFSGQWANSGAAPCLPGGHPAITLKDGKGGIAAVFADDKFNASSLPVAPPGQAKAVLAERSFPLPFNLLPGKYEVYISIGDETGQPSISLPLAGNDGHKRYHLGQVEITGDYLVQAGELQKIDNHYNLPIKWKIYHQLPNQVSPFFHFCIGDNIVFQGNPSNNATFAKPLKEGDLEMGCSFEMPKNLPGNKLEVKVGLWLPDHCGMTDERLYPVNGDNDRRVTLGTLSVERDGRVSFTPLSPAN